MAGGICKEGMPVGGKAREHHEVHPGEKQALVLREILVLTLRCHFGASE